MIVRAEAARRDQAGRHADRGDQRQHRHRAGDGGGDARLPHGAGDAGAPERGAAPDDARLRRGNRADAEGRRHGSGARHRRANARRGQGHHPRPVRQSGQSARALRRHRAGNLARHRRARSPISSAAWAPPAPSWAARATSRKRIRTIQIIGCQPTEGSQIPGIRKWPQAYLPKICDFSARRPDRRSRQPGRGRGNDAPPGARGRHLRRHLLRRRAGRGAAQSRPRSKTPSSSPSSATAATAIFPPACFRPEAR